MKISVGVYMYGDRLDPEIVSAVVRAKASETRRRGDSRVLKDGSTVIAKTGLWARRVHRDDSEVELAIADLLEDFADERVDEIPSVERAILDIFLIANDAEMLDEVQFVMPKLTIDHISRLGLQISVTIGKIGPQPG